MDAINKKISAGTRIGSMLLDHFFMTMIAVLFAIPAMVSTFGAAMNAHGRNLNFMSGAFDYSMLIGFALYFCKDAIGGRSIAKRILKLQVVDNVTGQAASPFKCLLRNLFCIIWPVEVIVALVNPARRLGDRVAGTKLVMVDPAAEKPKIKIAQAGLSLLLAYGILLLVMLPLRRVMSQMEMEGENIDYVESSLNPQEGQVLQKALSDSLGTYFSPDVAIYDTVRHEHIKYISVTLELKENYLADDYSYTQINKLTTKLIYSKYPKETVAGSIQYVFSTSGHIQMRMADFGREMKAK